MSSQTFNDFQMNAYRRGVGTLVNQLTEVLSGRMPVNSFILDDADQMPEDVKKQLKTILVVLANVRKNEVQKEQAKPSDGAHPSGAIGRPAEKP